jgi:hypothetical protein
LSAPATAPSETGRTAGNNAPRRAAAFAAAGVALVYFGLFNHDFSVNALQYAGAVERGTDLFHPNHLLPNAVHRVAYLIATTLGSGGRAIWLMQALTVGAGIVAAAALAHVAACRGGIAAALSVAALYAFGFAAWNFAEEPDVYVLPAAAVALSIALLDARQSLSWRAVVALGLLAVWAVLTLQQYVFWYPTLLALVARRDLGARRGAKLAVLAVGVPAICLAAYLLAGAALGRLDSPGHALGWFLGYAWDPHSGFGTYRAAPEFAARLLGTLLGLGNLAVAYEVILSRVALIGAAAAAIAIAATASAIALALRRQSAATRGDAAIVLCWMLANLAFATWWESRNIEFLFPVWLGACALAALAVPALRWRLPGVAALLLFIVNAGVAFVPQRDWPQRYRIAEELARHERLGGSDVLITEELNTTEYLRYFDRVDVRFQPGAVSAAMHAAKSIAQARRDVDFELAAGTRVYTTEIDENGRLRALARRFARLGRAGFDGDVERDLQQLYAGLDTRSEPVAGARRVRAEAPDAH